MNTLLKGELQAMCTLIDAVGIAAEIEDMSCAARMEMAKYLMYLSASDGVIKPAEAMMIGEVLDFEVSAQWVNEFTREQNVYSVEFERGCPPVLNLFVILDNDRYAKGEVGGGFLSERMVSLYKKLGVELLKADGAADVREKTDFDIFVGMLDRYLDENLQARSAGIKTNFTK